MGFCIKRNNLNSKWFKFDIALIEIQRHSKVIIIKIYLFKELYVYNTFSKWGLLFVTRDYFNKPTSEEDLEKNTILQFEYKHIWWYSEQKMTDSKVNTLIVFIIGMVQIIDSSTVAHILSSNDGSIQVSTTTLFIYSVLFNQFYVYIPL